MRLKSNSLRIALAILSVTACKESAENNPADERIPSRQHPNREIDTHATATSLPRDSMDSESEASNPSSNLRYEDGVAMEDFVDSISNTYSGEDLQEAYETAIAAFSSDQWKEMIEFLAIVPPSIYSQNAFNIGLRKLIDDHGVGFFNDEYDTLNSLLDDSRMGILALKFGTEAGKGENIYAAEWISSNPSISSLEKASFFVNFFTELDESANFDALAVTSAINDPEIVYQIVMDAGDKFWGRLPINESVSLVEGYAGKREAADLAKGLGSSLGLTDTPPFSDSGEYFKDPELREDLYAGYFSTLASKDLNQALIRVQEISDTKLRDKSIEQLLPRISKYNSAVLPAWIDLISNSHSKSRLMDEYSNGN